MISIKPGQLDLVSEGVKHAVCMNQVSRLLVLYAAVRVLLFSDVHNYFCNQLPLWSRPPIVKQDASFVKYTVEN